MRRTNLTTKCRCGNKKSLGSKRCRKCFKKSGTKIGKIFKSKERWDFDVEYRKKIVEHRRRIKREANKRCKCGKLIGFFNTSGLCKKHSRIAYLKKMEKDGKKV